jgi:anti-sigma regulatory factor (Ser/Thr protein kinase)
MTIGGEIGGASGRMTIEPLEDVCAATASVVLARLSGADVLPLMCWRRVFPGSPEQGSSARGFVRSLLRGHSLLDDIVVTASELFSNAMRHSRSGLPGGLVLMEIRQWRRGVALAVIDQGGPAEPVQRSVEQTAAALCDAGRGLATVAACANNQAPTWAGMRRRTIRATGRASSPERMPRASRKAGSPAASARASAAS